MGVLKAIWNWIKAFFGSNGEGGILLKQIAQNAGSEAAQAIKDNDLGKKALEFVKELNERKDITNKEKAEIFNAKLKEYALKAKKTIGEATINLLRELAVAAIKSAAAAAVAALV